jgi:TetR/AcrR family transcriptional repressor of nem operon
VYLREAVVVAFARWQERVAELVRQAQAEGALDPSLPAEQVAGLLLHGWEGALMRARLDRDTAPLVDFLEIGLPRLLA